MPGYKEEERGKAGQCQVIKGRREEKQVSASLERGGERNGWSVPVYEEE